MKENVFIDTSIFIAENFFLGKKLEKIGLLANQEKINMLITTVVDEEIKANISKRVVEVKDANSKYKRSLKYKYKIVKNIYELNNIVFNDSNLEQLLLDKYDRFKEYAKIKIIHPQEKFEIAKVLNKYFKSEAPFNISKKKSEFPDAISLKIIEDYCGDKNIRAIHLSSDKDFEGLDYENIEFKNDFGDLIIELTRKVFPENFKDEELVYKFIEENEDKFIELIRFELQLELLIYFHLILNEGIELTTDDINVKELKISKYSVLDIEKNYVSFICKGKYKSVIPQEVNFRLNKEEHSKILSENNFTIKENKFVEAEGVFEMTLHYSYEYRYKAIEGTIEFDEDEKKIKNITPI